MEMVIEFVQYVYFAAYNKMKVLLFRFCKKKEIRSGEQISNLTQIIQVYR